MADVNANIGVNIDASDALVQLKNLQRQIAQFHSAVAKSSDAAALAQRDLQKNFINGVNSIGAFSAELRTVRTTAESFTNSLEKNKFSMREYFRYSAGATRTFGRLFRSEFDTVNKVAVENVKRLQTQYIKMGRDASGAMKAIAIMPTELDMTNLSTKTQIAAQRQAIFNQLVKQGSTNLLNFGKNTQWAGRQLMVGFTLPLMTLGSVATRTFMEMETAAIKFKKVYGDMFTAPEETKFALESIQMLGQEFTKYGIAVSNTVSLAAEAAAAGFQGQALQTQVTQATRLQVLGQVEQQKALETTISLQNAFQMQSEELADAINFLNAVENQTVVSLDDITTAIPKAAPVVKQLGGDVRDLAFFMAAMKEGGINASEGANALKSGLASLINPTNKARAMMEGFGIDIDSIVNKNAGNVKQTVIEFAEALDGLSNLNRQRAIEQLFGKFQLARLSTLFDNVIKDGNQASRVLDLAALSMEDLASMAEKELGITADSTMNKFRASVENLKLALVPVGESFLQVITPILEKLNSLLNWFNGLSDTSKKVITKVLLYLGGIAPVLLMTIGLMANFVANGIKGLNLLRNGFLRLTGQSKVLGEQTNYLTIEQQNAYAAAHSLEQSHARLAQTFTVEAGALAALRREYGLALTAANNFALANPMMMMPRPGKKYANGVVSVPGPKGAGDIIPAMLSPGEAVIPSKMAEKYAPLINGMIAGNIPGYMAGTVSVGGRVTGLDFAKSDTAAKAQRIINEILKEGSGIENGLSVVNEALARMATDTKISISGFLREMDLVTKELTGAVIPGDIIVASGRGERKYTAKGAGISENISEQVAGNPALEEEVARAQASNVQAQRAIKEYYQKIGVDINGTTKESEKARKVVAQAGEVHRAHVIEMQDNTDKMFREAWSTDAWIAQSSTLNQLSNIMEKSPATLNEYLKNLNEVNADEIIVNSIREKITKNIALTEQELAVQKQVLERMLASTSTMAKVAPGFGPQATGAVAATNYLIQNPASQAGVGSRTPQQQAAARQAITQARFRGEESFVPVTAEAQERLRLEAQRLGTSAVQGAATGAGTASPSKKTIPIGEDIVRGLEVGMMNRADDAARVAGTVASGAASSMRNTGLLGPSGAPIYVPNTPESDPRGPLTPALIDDAYKEKEERERKQPKKGRIRGMVGRGAQRVARGGGGFGLSGLLFGLSMLPGKFGQLAQSIMPAVFALQGLGMLTRIIGGWPTILLAVGVGLFMLNKNAHKAAQEIADAAKLEAEARLGSTKAIQEYAEFTGKALPSAREFSRNNRQIISASGQAVKRFAEFYGQKENRSSKIITNAATKGKSAGIEAAAIDVAQRAAMFGLSPADIAANIKAASDLIGADQVELKAKIQTLLAPNGKDITKEPLTVKARMEFLAQDSTRNAQAVKKTIEEVSKIDIAGIKSGGRASGLSFERLKEAAGTQKNINKAYSGGALGNTFGALQQVGAQINSSFFGQGKFGSDINVIKEYKNVQNQVQTAGVQISLAFTQQRESLALLNAQYADGIITEKEYSEGLTASLENFDVLGESTKEYIAALNEIDESGELAAGALEDLGTEALAGIKKANPGLYKKLAKALSDVKDNAEVDIYVAYQKGSLTLMDLATLPKILEEIDGKDAEAAITILAKYDLSEGGNALVKKIIAQTKLVEIGLAIAAGGITAELAKSQSYYSKMLADAEKVLAEKARVNKTGNLDTDDGNGNNKGKGDGKDKFFEKELAMLNKKRDALKEINDEMKRQNDYQQKQMDLISKAAQAKISGNYLQAAMLGQQSIGLASEYSRESKELQLGKVIDITEAAKSAAEKRKKMSAGDYKLRDNIRSGNYGAIAPMAKTPNTGLNYPTGGVVYNNTINQTIYGPGMEEVKKEVLKVTETALRKNNKSNKVIA